MARVLRADPGPSAGRTCRAPHGLARPGPAPIATSSFLFENVGHFFV